jgi:hypothetical protein
MGIVTQNSAAQRTTSMLSARGDRRWPVIVATLIVVVLNVAVLVLHHSGLGRPALLSAVLVFCVMMPLCRRLVGRLRRHELVIITAITQLPGVFSAPLFSDDVYRYVWDGHVQLAGIDPYRYAPLDHAVAFLRNPVLFPGGTPLINRPSVHTIYPPLAELWFSGIAAVVPWRWGVLGLQIAGLLLVIVTVLVLARALSAGFGNPGWALIYGACPATMIEAVNSAHVDALASFLIAAMICAILAGRGRITGVLLGLAAGVKLVPLLLLPCFLLARRGPQRLRGVTPAAVLVLVASYLPHLLVVGALVLGYLPGYLHEEGFDGRRRFALLIMVPEQARLPMAALLAVGCALWALIRSRTRSVLITCCLLYGAAFLIATPTYPWYLLPFIVLVIAARRFEWLILWPAAYVGYLHDRDELLQSLGYGIAFAVIVGCALVRHRRGGDRSRGGPPTGSGRFDWLRTARPARGHRVGEGR